MANQPLRAGSSMHSRRKSLSMEVLRDCLPTPASSEDSWLTGKEMTSSDRPAHLPEVACRIACAEDDAEAVVFDFLNEGAANVVFSLRPYQPHGPHDAAPRFVFFRRGQTIPRSKVLRRVLRISKGKPKTLPSEDIVRDFEAEIRPLFRPKERPSIPNTPSTSNTSSTPGTPSTPNAHSTTLQGLQDPDALYPARSLEYFLLDHELVHLPSDVLKVLLRAQYASDEIPTAPLEEQRGILLPDMSEVPGVSMTVEFKPKWLAASPNAPRSAYRCRTCALHAKRLAEVDGESPPSYICPLQLVHGNRAIISDVIKDKFPVGNESNILERVTEKAVDYLTVGPGHDLLMHLRHLQLQLDPIGVLHLPKYPQDMDPVIHRLRFAMTLRDCSLFLRITYANDWTPIEAKLVDLDFKSKDKYHDWHDKELKLVNGGWYTDLKAGVNQCLLAEGWLKWVPHYM